MSYLVGANLTDTMADLNAGKGFGLGDMYQDQAGQKYVFVQASGTPAQYDVVAISSAGVAQPITKALADTGPMVGVAMATISSGSYGWAMVKGTVSINVLQTCSSSVALYTSGTAGKLDDTSTSQDKLAGVVILSNNTTTSTQAIVGTLATEAFVAL